MHLSNIVAATDESDAGRQAVWTALELASKTGARVSVLHVVPVDSNGSAQALEQLARWVESDLPPIDPLPSMTYSLAYGLPGIEIGRFAEQVRALADDGRTGTAATYLVATLASGIVAVALADLFSSRSSRTEFDLEEGDL